MKKGGLRQQLHRGIVKSGTAVKPAKSAGKDLDGKSASNPKRHRCKESGSVSKIVAGMFKLGRISANEVQEISSSVVRHHGTLHLLRRDSQRLVGLARMRRMHADQSLAHMAGSQTDRMYIVRTFLFGIRSKAARSFKRCIFLCRTRIPTLRSKRGPST